MVVFPGPAVNGALQISARGPYKRARQPDPREMEGSLRLIHPFPLANCMCGLGTWGQALGLDGDQEHMCAHHSLTMELTNKELIHHMQTYANESKRKLQ